MYIIDERLETVCKGVLVQFVRMGIGNEGVDDQVLQRKNQDLWGKEKTYSDHIVCCPTWNFFQDTAQEAEETGINWDHPR